MGAADVRRHNIAGLRKHQTVSGKVLCCYCSCELIPHQGKMTPGKVSERMETLEHLKRKTDGGKNNPGNLALACHGCNISRGNLDWCTFKSLKQGELTYAG